ncbi:MAG: transporter substrate-binding domain-containing protein [Rhodobacteraceae bacterium]|jgi:polar amino acid transport system substrate-binding protein|nr:transporter substrate-binding domain-containing protein [Alphaproteobacteria bacterium]MBT8475735.1 transporter substrate-binding domain-containing protein [Alphaproteobacteria bacterium]NNF72678.1 transporter substrate-binding domain-containing protein [Paracoccaceae bacterium]NNK65119.1 transporter substrate-binding domain-containing protein [Paracoccaceae bacterium]
MKNLILTAAALALTAGVAMAGSHSVVRLGTEGAYPPWNFINDDGEVDGFERELGDELCARAELTCEWVTNEWDSIIPNLVSGNYDAIIAGMSITDERDEVIDFTQNYTPPDPSAYVALSEDADLAGGVIAAQTGTLQAGYIAESGATLIEFATPDETIAAVKNGEADAVLADASYLQPIVDQDPDLMMVGDPVPLGDGVGMGIRESDAELRDKFDAAITAMKEDGSLNALIEKWEVSSQF